MNQRPITNSAPGRQFGICVGKQKKTSHLELRIRVKHEHGLSALQAKDDEKIDVKEIDIQSPVPVPTNQCNACNQVHRVRPIVLASLSLILFQAVGMLFSCEMILFGVAQAGSYCIQFYAPSVPYAYMRCKVSRVRIQNIWPIQWLWWDALLGQRSNSRLLPSWAKLTPGNIIFEFAAKSPCRRAPGSALSCSRACSACSSSRASSWTRRTSTASTFATSAPSTSSRYNWPILMN